MWLDQGCSLALTRDTFARLLSLPTDDSDSLCGGFFEMFDTDRNGKVDFLEVMAALIIFSRG